LSDTRLLAAQGVDVRFEGVHALQGVDLALEPGVILGLIGPNGAGKTTLVNVLTGYQRPDEGAVHLDGSEVTRLTPEKLARRGLGRTFQAVRPFSALSVRENVELGAIGSGASSRDARETATLVLERLGLDGVADIDASALPAGHERRLGLARALAGRPRYLLLDEPAAGLNEREGDALVETLRAIRDADGIGLLLIEHDMRVVMDACDRIQVLDHGATIAEGTPDAVRRDEAVLAAYLGPGAR
jgi:branched-chain amino acid transport system ATP-binding protein